jgi:hypothetical protein
MTGAGAKLKGNLLEDVVARLHESRAGKVETRVKVPALGSSREREVDVLITQQVVGYPVRLAIECKNEQDPVGVGRIGEFIDKLNDVGIPVAQGIFVTPVGYTADARGRAEKAGIRLLVLDGLDANRMAAAVNDALMAVVHYVLLVDVVNIFPYLPQRASSEAEEWPAAPALNEISVQNRVWIDWLTRTKPIRLGESERFFYAANGSGAIVSYRIAALVGQIPGTERRFALRNANTNATERSRIEADFSAPTTLALEFVEAEEELTRLKDEVWRQSHRLVQFVRVPRLISGSVFWPPTEDALQKIAALRARGDAVTFATVEGKDLSRAWEYSQRTQPDRNADA